MLPCVASIPDANFPQNPKTPWPWLYGQQWCLALIEVGNPWSFHCTYSCLVSGSHVSFCVIILERNVSGPAPQVLKFSSEKWILHRELTPGHAQAIMADGQNRWFWHSTFSGSSRDFKCLSCMAWSSKQMVLTYYILKQLWASSTFFLHALIFNFHYF